MRAIRIDEPWQIDMVDIEKPIFKDGEALIKLRAAGICGSDIGAYRGVNNLVSYPRVIGHELAGEIVSVPDNALGIKPGDRVIVDPYRYCGTCYPCSLGRTNCCTDLKVLGVQVDGGLAEYFTHPVELLIPAPETIPWDLLPLAEPLTIALHGLHRLELKAGEHIAIFGAGPIGLLAAMAAQHEGARPIVIDPVAKRLELARTLGAVHTIHLGTESLSGRIAEITDGRLCECVMEASGANSAIRDTLNVVSHAGRVALTGWPKTETSLPTDLITKKELDIRGARTSVGEFELALELIGTGAVDVGSLLTKCVPMEQAAEVIRDMESNPGAYMKVNVTV